MDEKPKHTPGPWNAIVERDFISILGNDGEEVCYIDAAEEKEKKNAALISAAPELLDALKDAVLEFGCGSSIHGDCSCFIREKWRCASNPGKCFVQRWLAAIRKAEGLKQEGLQEG